jgi:hypothetical protein
MSLSSVDAPPGMTWKETLTDRGTHIYFSGTPAPRGLVWMAWSLIALGVFYELLFNDVLLPGGTTQGSVVAMQAVPVALIVIGAALAWKWRQGGGSSGVLDVGRAALSVQRGLLSGPLELEPRQVRELVVGDQAQDYQVQTASQTSSATARWYQVTLVTAAGKQHALACFGEHACAAFYVRRVSELLNGALE